MPVATAELSVATEGNGDVIDITPGVTQAVRTAGISEGVASVFVAHSTAAVTTIEYEPGCVHDFKEITEQLVPKAGDYRHNRLAGDTNAHAHLRASIVGSSQTLPIKGGRLITGTWQQIVLVDFDDRPRQRQVTVQVVS